MGVKQPVIRDPSGLGAADDRAPHRVGEGIRVVIADDERDTVMTLGILLRSEGFDVRLVHVAAEVPAVVAEALPHAVLLDIQMPGRSGHAVAEELRATYGERCPVLIAITALNGASDKKQAESSGFHHFFTKPCDPTELLRLLSSLRPDPQGAAGA
jgi:CheY-like chemotaxis protein